MNDPDRLAELMRLTRRSGGQIDPLVVVAVAMRVHEEGRSSHISGVVEDEEGLVSVGRHLQDLHSQLAPTLLPLTVAQHHELLRREVAEAILARAGGLSDRQADLRRRFVGTGRSHGERDTAGDRQAQGQRKGRT